jgi:hypothetical protein
MRFRKKPGPAPLPKATRDVLHEAQDRQSIRAMIERGAVLTPIGATTHLRLDTGGYAAFPSALVEDVRREMLASVERRLSAD